MIQKVYEIDPMIYPRCGGRMKVIAFLTDSGVVDRVINHLKTMVERDHNGQNATAAG
jgi:hypothetical protein